MNILRLSAVAFIALVAPMLAQASTVHTVLYTGTGIVETGLENGDLANETLTMSNGASVSVFDSFFDTVQESFLGFEFEPENAPTRFSIALNELDEFYGGMEVSVFGDEAKSMQLASGVVDSPDYRLSLGLNDASPIWVHLDWSNTQAATRETGGDSFNYDVEVVPLPAAGFLLLGALGGLAGLKRRRKG
jgi:hypothetical protein